MTITPRVRIADGTDRGDTAFGHTWRDVTADVASERTVIAAGRSDEAGTAAPKHTEWLFHNSATENYRYTPGHPSSDLTDFGQGTPIEYAVRADGLDPYLWCTGNADSSITTPDHASLRVTGDHWAGIEAIAPIAINKSPLNFAVFGRSNTGTNDVSWVLLLDPGGVPTFVWSPDGTFAAFRSLSGTAAVPRPAAGTCALGWVFDADNGASGCTITWYFHRDTLENLRLAVIAGDTSVQLGDPVTQAGVATIHPGTQHMFLGGNLEAGGIEYPGRLRAAELRDGGPSGTRVAHPVVTAQAAGATSWADDSTPAKTWTVTGDATVTDYYVRFLGEVTSVVPHAPGHGVAGTQMARVSARAVQSRDRQREKALKSVLYRVETTQTGDDMIALWPMEDTSGATRFASPIAGVSPMGFGPAGVATLASDSTLVASSPLPHIGAGRGWGYQAAVPARSGITNFRGTIFFNIPDLVTTGAQELFTLRTTGTVASWKFFLDDTTLIFQGYSGANVLLVNPGGTVATEWGDGWTQLTLGVEQDGANIDWAVAWLAASGNVYGFAGTVAGTIGYPQQVAGLFTIDGEGISLGHCSVTTDLAASWLGWTDGARLAYAGEEDWERVRRLTSERDDWAAAHTGQNADISATLGPQEPRKYVELLTDAAEAGLGILGDHPTEFGYHLRTRASLYNQAVRWTVDAGTVAPFEPAHDATKIVNDVTVTRTAGGEAHDEDTVSIARRGRFDAAPTLNVETDEVLDEIASWLVFLGAWEEMRWKAWTVALSKDVTLIPGWVGMALGDVLELAAAPAWVGVPSVRQLLQGYTETIQAGTPGLWEVRANGSPADPYTVGVLEDSVYGRLDTDGSQLTSSVTAGALSGSVTITDGPLWITTALYPTEFPFTVRIDHEDLAVSAVSGTSSPQTFTWSRGANGTTAAAHSAGAAVRLRYPLRLAM